MASGEFLRAAVRGAITATVAGYATALLATVTPSSTLLDVLNGSNTVPSQDTCCFTSEVQTSDPTGSLRTLRNSVQSSCHCTNDTINGTSKGTASWKSAYAGSATAEVDGTISHTSREGTTSGYFEWFYTFSTNTEYDLVADCSVDGSGPAGRALSVNVYIDSGTVVCTNAALSASGSVHLTAGTHTLYGKHQLSLDLPAGQTGVAKQRSSITWRFEGCETRPEIPISNNTTGGIVDDFHCDPGDPNNTKNEWDDEQGALFRLTCETDPPATASAFYLRYHPDGTDPFLSAAKCVWASGLNFGNIFTPGDSDNDGIYDCFIRSFWSSREGSSTGEGVPGMEDRCIFKFDVKTKTLTSIHEVFEPTTNRWRRARASEYGGIDQCQLPAGGSGLAPEAADGMSGGGNFCDQNGDDVCDASEDSILVLFPAEVDSVIA